MGRPNEVMAVQWRKGRRSQEQGACVEVADLLGLVAIRDSKDPAGPRLNFSTKDWREFHDQVTAGKYDL